MRAVPRCPVGGGRGRAPFGRGRRGLGVSRETYAPSPTGFQPPLALHSPSTPKGRSEGAYPRTRHGPSGVPEFPMIDLEYLANVDDTALRAALADDAEVTAAIYGVSYFEHPPPETPLVIVHCRDEISAGLKTRIDEYVKANKSNTPVAARPATAAPEPPPTKESRTV